MHVNFNYQLDPNGKLRTEESFAITQLVEYRLGDLDFAIVRLDGDPGATFGTAAVSTTDAANGDMLCIIGHPAGAPKMIEAGPQFHLHGDHLGYDSIDTLGGNSGSGVVASPAGRIVGVHTNGGCDNAAVGHNHGVRMISIHTHSPTIQQLAQATTFDTSYYYRLTNNFLGADRSLDVINDGNNDTPHLAPTGNFTGQRWTLTRVKPIRG